MSLPEVMLWQRLRMRPHSLKFRRQHPVSGYILDFYCPAARLAIEIDGEAHNRGDRPRRDEWRDTSLKTAVGLTVLHVPAFDVLRDTDAVVRSIVLVALPLHRPAGGPPPQALLGEDCSGVVP